MKDPSLYIERYLNDALSKAHKAEFEAALLRDANLQALLDARKSLHRLLEAQRLRQKVARAYAQNRLHSRVRRRRLWVAAVVFLSIAGIVPGLRPSQNKPQSLDVPQLRGFVA